MLTKSSLDKPSNIWYNVIKEKQNKKKAGNRYMNSKIYYFMYKQMRNKGAVKNFIFNVWYQLEYIKTEIKNHLKSLWELRRNAVKRRGKQI